MLSVHSMPMFRQIGQNITPTIQKVPPVDSVVPRVNKTVTYNITEQFNNLKHRATDLSQKMNISYDSAVKELHKQGEHFIDIMA